jgi:elongator complex protein 3
MTNPLRKELFKGNNFVNISDFSKINNSIDKNHYYAIVRELHVYGPVAGISRHGESTNPGRSNNEDSIRRSRMDFDSHKGTHVENVSKLEFQHKGLGRALLSEAEKICKDEYQIKALSVISAVGTRDYYGKFGYTNNGPYVTKLI